MGATPPLDTLKQLNSITSRYESRLASIKLERDRQVVRARQQGATWAEIVDASGLSRQALHKIATRLQRKQLP